MVHATRLRRINHLQELKLLIREAHKKDRCVYKEKTIADLSLRWGSARRTVLEYINTLVKGDYIGEEKDLDGLAILFWKEEGELKLAEELAEKEAENVFKALQKD